MQKDDEKAYIRRRIWQLCEQNNVSSRNLSFTLGKSSNYITNILSGRHLPSIDGLLDICDFFSITLNDFFSYNEGAPTDITIASDMLRTLSADEKDLAIDIIKLLAQKSKN